MADALAAELAKAKVEDSRIVSFEGQGLKLDNAESGTSSRPFDVKYL